MSTTDPQTLGAKCFGVQIFSGSKKVTVVHVLYIPNTQVGYGITPYNPT